MAHEGLHESAELLDDRIVDRHRAIESLVEELEAIDWYDQRVEATRDPDLASVLAHNRDDEKEHAAMALEWIRRRDPALDEQLRIYLFSDGPLVSVEDTAAPTDSGGGVSPGFGLGIGSLREAS
jgi:ferritin-like protein